MDSCSQVMNELSTELDRILGEGGTRRFVENKIEFWRKIIENGESGVCDCFVDAHDALVEYLEKLNENLPF